LTFSVIIPARYASTRFPGKPLVDLGGKPMVVRVCERAAKSGAAGVHVATDDERIAAAVRAHGFKVVITRADHPSGTDRLEEAATQLKLGERDIVVNVQGDEPLIEPALIDACAALLQHQPACVMSTVAHPIHQLDEFRTIDRGFHTAISRACGNPLLQEVYGKTLGALFNSGELASLLYAEINRHEVSAIIASSTAAHRAIAEALVAGRRKGTIAAVQAHLDDVERRMIDRLL